MTLLEPPTRNGDAPRTLIDELLEEQQSLTAVARFARQHERGAMPAQARYYRELIPLEKPQPGEQYAFAVDLDACTGCKACVSACHSLNGLDEDEAWRDVGLIVGGSSVEPYLQTVTTACHHCAEPGCMLGCPVGAYEKNAETGIVRHLDDQCIGCQYCILKCPYDVPKYSKRRGIVRKCDMCQQRLAADEAPACVQACPNGAITIRTVTAAEVRTQTEPGVKLIHGAFDSSYTKPTTSYTTRKSIPLNAQPGDVYRLRLEHPHWPLIAMLLLSQLSAGVFIVLAFLTPLPKQMFASIAAPLAFFGFGALQAGLILSVFHLGQPMKAWRFFLGLRTSWMSREILAFGLFAGAGAALTLVSVFHLRLPREWLSMESLKAVPPFLASFTPEFAWLTAILALVAIFCSAMIYVDTHRPAWSGSVTFSKFFGTTLLLGMAGAAAVLSGLCTAEENLAPLARIMGASALCCAVIYAGGEAFFLRQSLLDPHSATHRSARTMWKLLRPQLALRGALIGVAVLVGLAACFATGAMQALLAVMFLGLQLGSAIIERYCFFTASDAPRMPGGIST